MGSGITKRTPKYIAGSTPLSRKLGPKLELMKTRSSWWIVYITFTFHILVCFAKLTQASCLGNFVKLFVRLSNYVLVLFSRDHFDVKNDFTSYQDAANNSICIIVSDYQLSD